MATKIVEFDNLGRAVRDYRFSSAAKIIHCHGCFDLLHVGHVRHLKEAKSFCGFLVVTITPDCFINKDVDRPIIPMGDRAEMLAALECVGMVAINQYPTAVEVIEIVQPDVFVKGHEFVNNRPAAIVKENSIVERYGGIVRFTSPSHISTTDLVRKIRGT
jgi:rfaE bifunctional protein nucleotidyltransferase chain/domain